MPEGPTAYVLTQEDAGLYIWNASTGEKYSQTDSYCPLQSVGCVANDDNVRVYAAYKYHFAIGVLQLYDSCDGW